MNPEADKETYLKSDEPKTFLNAFINQKIVLANTIAMKDVFEYAMTSNFDEALAS